MTFNDGDVIGFSGVGLVSDGINLATYGIPRWNISHVGIVCSYQGEQYMFESTTTNGEDRCAILGVRVCGVQAHRLNTIVSRPGKVWRYPLARPLYTAEQRRLRLSVVDCLGLPYDFLGAGRSGGALVRILEKAFREEDMARVFCSELVAHCLTKVGLTYMLNASGQNPNSLVRRLSREHVVRGRERIR